MLVVTLGFDKAVQQQPTTFL